MGKTLKKKSLYAVCLALTALVLILCIAGGVVVFAETAPTGDVPETETAAEIEEEPAEEVGWFTLWLEDVKDTFYKCFIRENRYMLLVNGIGVTIKVSILSAVMGMVIGFFVAICNLSKYRILNLVGKIYTDVIRGTPSVTQLMIIYFVVFASVHWEKWLIASIAFAINSGAYVSEIIRAGILSIDKGQTEAGRSLGLNGAQTMMHIVVPQAVKNIFPAMGNEFITLIKETAIVGYVGLVDIQKAGDFIKSATYEAFMPLIGTAIIYFVIIKILTLGLGAIEKRLRKSEVR